MADQRTQETKIEFTAKITGPDGRVIEKTVTTIKELPTPEAFDLSTKEGFLADMDMLEKAILEARNAIGSEIAEGFLDDAIKKNLTRNEPKK